MGIENVLVYDCFTNNTDRHEGNAIISEYFRNLNKLSYGDIATVYYKGRTYNYKLVNTYEIEKTGTAHIKRKCERSMQSSAAGGYSHFTNNSSEFAAI